MELGWACVKGTELESLVMTKIGMMLRDSAWKEVKWKWEVEAQDRSKLGVMQRLLVHEIKDRCYAERRYCTGELKLGDLKQEREAVVDCMMELDSEFLTATNGKKE